MANFWCKLPLDTGAKREHLSLSFDARCFYFALFPIIFESYEKSDLHNMDLGCDVPLIGHDGKPITDSTIAKYMIGKQAKVKRLMMEIVSSGIAYTHRHDDSEYYVFSDWAQTQDSREASRARERKRKSRDNAVTSRNVTVTKHDVTAGPREVTTEMRTYRVEKSREELEQSKEELPPNPQGGNAVVDPAENNFELSQANPPPRQKKPRGKKTTAEHEYLQEALDTFNEKRLAILSEHGGHPRYIKGAGLKKLVTERLEASDSIEEFRGELERVMGQWRYQVEEFAHKGGGWDPRKHLEGGLAVFRSENWEKRANVEVCEFKAPINRHGRRPIIGEGQTSMKKAIENGLEMMGEMPWQIEEKRKAKEAADMGKNHVDIPF